MKKLSTLAKTYLVVINILGICILISNLDGMRVSNPVLLTILALLGGVLHVLKVEGPTNRSHFTVSFIVFGFTIAIVRKLRIF